MDRDDGGSGPEDRPPPPALHRPDAPRLRASGGPRLSPPHPGLVVHTIGYEQATPGALIDRLRAAGVEQLLDVRAVAASRRAGFAKTALSGALAEAGIAYLHLRELGTPSEGRTAARAGRTADMRAIYADHLAQPPALAAWAKLTTLVAGRPSALLCLEADAAHCHRRVLTERLSAELAAKVVDL